MQAAAAMISAVGVHLFFIEFASRFRGTAPLALVASILYSRQ
jgi:hypothetical protein